ncbi:MAG: cytochrome c1 [Gammaproteobacteria bacterium]|nr:MAG: cytochrome c1 [Gammaproteobacteria bacterium]
MKKILLLLLTAWPVFAMASSAEVHLDKANINLEDKASLQRGAKFFVNYCLSCHSAKYMRYNRLMQDLGLTEEQVKKYLMFTAEKVGETMEVAMAPDMAERWFGVAPPDLSVIARARGVDWLYTYLRSFYLDPSRPFGVNNLVFKDVAMPDVLWELQGWQRPKYETVTHEGHEEKVIVGLEPDGTGKMNPEAFDRAMRDLVAYLAYMGEPAKLERQRIGVWVLLYLAIFWIIAYALKKEYWKDVH